MTGPNTPKTSLDEWWEGEIDTRAAKFDQAPLVKSYFFQLFLPYFQLKLSYNFFLDGLWGELSYGVLILFELIIYEEY